MARVKFYSLSVALIFLFSLFVLPSHSFANSPYKIEINKKTNVLYLYKNNKVIKKYPVGTGREETLTPEGVFSIGSRAEKPAWNDRENNRIIPGGDPENPLGKYWLGIKIKNDNAQTYGIHGTNNENSVPGHVSKGCIRLKNAHIHELYHVYKIPLGTPVWIHSGNSNEEWLGGTSKEEVKAASGKIITTAQVNIRQGTSTSTNILGRVEKGKVLTITGETEEWYRIKWSGDKVGFISKYYANRHTDQPQPQPKTQPVPKPNDPAPNNETPANITIDAKTSFTKDGHLEISASIPEAKNASGNWKITLNGKVIADKEGEKTYQFTQKNPVLDQKQIKITISFDGTVDGKKATKTKELTYDRKEEEMKIKPDFKENRFQLEASLKGSQKATGVWTILIGETKRIVQSTGESLNEIFDSVTFDKKQLPVKIEFKGLIDTHFVTAKYEKELQVNLPDGLQHQIDQTGSQIDVEKMKETNEEEADKNKEDNEPIKSEDDDEVESQESEQKVEEEENQYGLNGEQTIASSNKEENSSNLSSQNNESSPTAQTNQQKVGGELPKTATTYPLGILIGFGALLFGIGTIRILYTKK